MANHRLDPFSLVGRRFGMLVIDGVPERKHLFWLVSARCDCGGTWSGNYKRIAYGGVKSCGCLNYRDAKAARASRHGRWTTRLWVIWHGMRQRCLSKTNKAYHKYGGRGVSICDDWMTFEGFAAWADSSGYRDDLSIDRIDNNGSYEPSNCRWATAMEQANNTAFNVWVEAFGEKKTIAQWLRDYRCVASRRSLETRLQRGWDTELAITKPMRVLIGRKKNVHTPSQPT